MLNQEEQKQWEQLEKGGFLQDPDAINVDSCYEWGEEYQRSVLGILANDVDFLISSQGLVKPNYFTNEVHRFVSRFIFDHHNKYSVLPSRIYIAQAIEDYIKEKDANTKVFYRGELATIYEYYLPGIEDRDYLLDQITDFAKQQAMKIAMFQSVKELNKPSNSDKWSKIQVIMEKAMSVDRNFDLGHNYFEGFRDRYALVAQKAATGDVFITGLPSIDNNLQGGGMVRGEIGSWIGLSGSGKSLALTRSTIANLDRGRRVLYVSLELNVHRTAERFDSMLTDPAQRSGVGINNLLVNKDMVFDALEDYSKDWEDKRRLIIKHFPGKEMDVSTFKAYYNQVKMRGFVPDLVIIDYIGEMRDHPNMPIHESRNLIIGQLRGFADREQVVVFTAMQVDGKSRELIRGGDMIDDDNLAEAKGQARPLDCLWSLNRRQSENETNVGRVKVIKHRSGKSRFHFYVSVCPITLRIEEITEDVWKNKVQNNDLKKDTNAQEKALEKIMNDSYKFKNKDTGLDQPNGEQ